MRNHRPRKVHRCGACGGDDWRRDVAGDVVCVRCASAFAGILPSDFTMLSQRMRPTPAAVALAERSGEEDEERGQNLARLLSWSRREGGGA